MANDVIARHLRACDDFSTVLSVVGDRWSWPTPCAEWDARAVVEHVIGFHDVLVLRPLGAKPERPKGDPVARWAVTVPAISSVLQGAQDSFVLLVPGASDMDLSRLLPMLTTDVLVHTWDLTTAMGAPSLLAPDLVGHSYAEASNRDWETVESSGMFAPPVPVPDDADVVTKLVALLGRDPAWRAPSG